MKFSILISPLTTPLLLAHPTDNQPLAHTADNSHSNGDPARNWSGRRPDGHAPIGVMGEHTHGAGEFTLSYRFMFMRMEQNYDGDTSIADSNFAGPPPAPFRVAPASMVQWASTCRFPAPGHGWPSKWAPRSGRISTASSSVPNGGPSSVPSSLSEPTPCTPPPNYGTCIPPAGPAPSSTTLHAAAGGTGGRIS